MPNRGILALKKLLIIFVSFLLVVVALGGCGQKPVEEELPAPAPPAEVSPAPTPPPSPPTPAPTQLTMLSITEGKVFVMRSGTDTWVEARVGMTLEVGDSIKAGPNSSAQITFFEGSTIELDADTVIEVAALDLATDTGSTTILIRQEMGKTVSRVEKLADPASRYEVETPAGVAAVRGSTVVVYVGEDGTTFICNIRGYILAIAQGVELPIPVGVCAVITPGQIPKLKGALGGGAAEPRGGYGG